MLFHSIAWCLSYIESSSFSFYEDWFLAIEHTSSAHSLHYYINTVSFHAKEMDIQNQELCFQFCFLPVVFITRHISFNQCDTISPSISVMHLLIIIFYFFNHIYFWRDSDHSPGCLSEIQPWVQMGFNLKKIFLRSHQHAFLLLWKSVLPFCSFVKYGVF